MTGLGRTSACVGSLVAGNNIHSHPLQAENNLLGCRGLTKSTGSQRTRCECCAGDLLLEVSVTCTNIEMWLEKPHHILGLLPRKHYYHLLIACHDLHGHFVGLHTQNSATTAPQESDESTTHSTEDESDTTKTPLSSLINWSLPQIISWQEARSHHMPGIKAQRRLGSEIH